MLQSKQFRDEENEYQVTPTGNTILHLAAHYGHSHFAAEVLNITPALLCHQNKKNETALHIVANEGHIEVVHFILSIEEHYKDKLMRMKDENGAPTLHKAVRSRHEDVASFLVKEDPEFEFPSNKVRETPMYLEAESGLREALVEILNSCKRPTSSTGPSNRTPLHAAVIQEHTDCVRLLLQWNKSLCEELDVGGLNSLHFAALLGLNEIISDMLGWKKSLAYFPAGSENDRTTAIHIAVGAGKVDILHELLNHCPDCWELLESNGRNALHESILYSQTNVVNFLLKPKWDKLIEDPDNDGNTPLHFLAFSNFWGYVSLELKDHP
ncbi:putative ankyrin repeat-containing protein-like [Capsicum annuum]|nr:putative ankyrin repeat-containing protein-like [Capsicum annuum]